MELRPGEMEHVAALARLRFGEEEEASIMRDLARVLEYMSVLDEVDTAGAGLVTRGNESAPEPRADEPAPGLGVEEALGEAPRRHEDYFLTPKAI